MAKPILVHGHRGSRGTHCENTFASFEEALRVGADFIELDVQLSTDNIPMVFHDPFLSGRHCWDPHRKLLVHPISLRTLTANEISRYYLGTYIEPRFPDQKLDPNATIPSLEQVLIWANKKGIRLNIELKMKVGNPLLTPDREIFSAAVVDLLKKYDRFKKDVVQSFDGPILRVLKAIAPEVMLSRLFRYDEFFFKKTVNMGIPIVTPHYSILDAEKIRRCHEANMKVWTYTLNSEEKWAVAIEKGVDAIITDYPEKLIQYLKRNSF